MLDKVIGNKAAKEYLIRAFHNNGIASSYIISGEKDTGQELLAYELGYSLLCENEDKPCEVCRSCKAARAGNHPDLIVLDHKEKNSIGVDDIREKITDTVAVKPFSSNKKIYIILEADKMTVQAQNSLLKTLEEPPFYAVFILATAHDGQLLSTIHSRCIGLETTLADDEEIKEVLRKKYGLNRQEQDRIVSVSFGKIEKAFFLAEHPEQLQVYSMIPGFISVLETGLFDKLRERTEEFEEKGVGFVPLLDLIKLWYRDVLCYLGTFEAENLIFQEFTEEIKIYSAGTDTDRVLRILAEIEETNNRLRANVGKELVLELFRQSAQENRSEPL